MKHAVKMADLTCGRNCVNERDFYWEIKKLKSKLKTKDSPITFYLDDDLYDKAKTFLKEKREKQLNVSGNKDWSESTEELTALELQTVRRKEWVYQNSEVFQRTTKNLFQNGSCFESCVMLTIEFPTEEGKLQRCGSNKIMQKSARKW